MRKSNEDLFVENLILNEDDYSVNTISERSPLKDFIIDEFLLVRIYESISIILLHSGSKYMIPIEYYNLFREFSFYNHPHLNKFEESNIGKFIYNMSLLMTMILRNFKDISSDEIVDSLNSLSKCGTNEIRKIIYDKLKITLGRINYESLTIDKLY